MSDNKKKALLNEATTKRFWTLAGLKPIHEKAYLFQEEEELDEMRAAKEDDKEEVDEMKAPQGSGIRGVYSDKSDDDDHEPTTKKVGTKGSTVTTAKARKMNEEDLEEMGLPAAEDEPEMEMDAEPEMDAPAEEGPEDGQDVEVDVPEGDVASLRTARDILDQILSAVDGGAEDEPEMEVDDAEPEMEEDPALQEVEQEELEEIAERIAARVARRITESLKIKK
jgi:hypothetical protein